MVGLGFALFFSQKAGGHGDKPAEAVVCGEDFGFRCFVDGDCDRAIVEDIASLGHGLEDHAILISDLR